MSVIAGGGVTRKQPELTTPELYGVLATALIDVRGLAAQHGLIPLRLGYGWCEWHLVVLEDTYDTDNNSKAMKQWCSWPSTVNIVTAGLSL